MDNLIVSVVLLFQFTTAAMFCSPGWMKNNLRLKLVEYSQKSASKLVSSNKNQNQAAHFLDDPTGKLLLKLCVSQIDVC